MHIFILIFIILAVPAQSMLNAMNFVPSFLRNYYSKTEHLATHCSESIDELYDEITSTACYPKLIDELCNEMLTNNSLNKIINKYSHLEKAYSKSTKIFSLKEQHYNTLLLRAYKEKFKQFFKKTEYILNKIHCGSGNIETVILDSGNIGIISPTRVSIARRVLLALDLISTSVFSMYNCGCFDSHTELFYYSVNNIGIFQCTVGSFCKQLMFDKINILDMHVTSMRGSVFFFLQDDIMPYYIYVSKNKCYKPRSTTVMSKDRPNPAQLLWTCDEGIQKKDIFFILKSSETSRLLRISDFTQFPNYKYIYIDDDVYKYTVKDKTSILTISSTGILKQHTLTLKAKDNESILCKYQLLDKSGKNLTNIHSIHALNGTDYFLVGVQDSLEMEFEDIGDPDYTHDRPYVAYGDLLLYRLHEINPIMTISNNVIFSSIGQNQHIDALSFVTYDGASGYTLHLWNNCSWFLSLTHDQMLLLLGGYRNNHQDEKTNESATWYLIYKQLPSHIKNIYNNTTPWLSAE